MSPRCAWCQGPANVDGRPHPSPAGLTCSAHCASEATRLQFEARSWVRYDLLKRRREDRDETRATTVRIAETGIQRRG